MRIPENRLSDKLQRIVAHLNGLLESAYGFREYYRVQSVAHCNGCIKAEIVDRTDKQAYEVTIAPRDYTPLEEKLAHLPEPF